MFKREIFETLYRRLLEPRRFIQVLTGPRQVGKTTLIRQVINKLKAPSLYISADEPTLRDRFWLEQQWSLARLEAPKNANHSILLVIDEVQKINNWSEIIKRLWDEDTQNKIPLKVVLLGSTPLLMQNGLKESLAGRFEQIPITHWRFTEMQAAFDWTLEQYIYFGGYPGAAELIQDETRWMRYINDSLIETTISRDILLLNPINKPALLRQLFQLGCHYSGQILSYQKMLCQLHDAGNTTTLAHYLQLLSSAHIITGLPKFAGHTLQQRASSPKLQVLNTALISAQEQRTFQKARADTTYWDRLTESAIGAYLVNSSLNTPIKIFYWREQNAEVDFIIQSGNKILPIEIKSHYRKTALPGITAFCKKFKKEKSLLVGGQGLTIEKFLSQPLEYWLEN